MGGRIGALSNDMGGRIGALSNSLIAAGQAITTLQEFDLVLYGDLRNLEGDVTALSNSLVGLEEDVGALSSTLGSELHRSI